MIQPAIRHALIKWTGSKRRTARQIVARFPRILDTYFEPFLGGGAVLDALLDALLDSDIEVARIECSDICEPLIAIWRLVQDDPRPLVDGYAEHWKRLGSHICLESVAGSSPSPTAGSTPSQSGGFRPAPCPPS